MDYQYFHHVFDQVDAATADYVSDTVSSMVSAVSPMVAGCMTLYIFLYGLAAYRGLINEYLWDGVTRIIKISLILTLATQAGQYSGLIADNLMALPDYLGRLVGQGSVTASSRHVLDQILSDGIDTGRRFWDEGSLSPLDFNIPPIILAITTWLFSFTATIYAAFLMILSKLALAVLVGLGPIFIMCILFDSTKRFFESWTQQVINFCLVSALTIGVVKLIFGILSNVASQNAASTVPASEMGIQSIAGLIIISLICQLVLLQVMGIASGLAGGIGLSSLGAGSAVASKAKGAIGWANKKTTNRERARENRDPSTWTRAASNKTLRPAAAWAVRSMKPAQQGNSVSKAG